MARVEYNFESERRLRAAFIGCGNHSFRNVYPVFQWVPVDLVAVCDRVPDRAASYGRTFGAQRTYADHEEMLDAEELDCVFVVTGYDETGATTHAGLAVECLDRGLPVWVEKPPVNDWADVAALQAAIERSGKQYAVGFKKAFTPAIRRTASLVSAPDFGEIRTISLRYSQPIIDKDEPSAFKRMMFLDHIGHPLSVLQFLNGRATSLYYDRAPNGGGFAVLEMASGAVANIHLAPTTSQRIQAERTEVNGDNASVIVENNTKVIHARNPGYVDEPGWGEGRRPRKAYGRESDFTGDELDGYMVWEPEFSLGQLYNKSLFLLGYYDEIAEFCRAVLDDRPIEVAGLDYAAEGLRLHEAFLQGPGHRIDLPA